MLSPSRNEVVANAIAQRTMEVNAALKAKAIVSSTESKNTRENYEHYQKHYKSWCEFFYGNGNHVVTKERLLAFLFQEVLYIKRKPGRKSEATKIREEQETNLRRQRVRDLNRGSMTLEELEQLEVDCSKIQCGKKTLQGFVTAICDLWTFQSSYEANTHPHPRAGQVKKLIESVAKSLNKDKDESYEDRLKDTALDTVSFAKYMETASYIGLDLNGKPKKESTCIAGRLNMLFLYSCMCRSQIVRYLRLSEVGVENVSSNPERKNIAIRLAMMKGKIRLAMMKGKTNQFERTQTVGIMRHKHVEYCTISALAIHLVHRFHIKGEEAPDFTNRESWYNSPLLKMDDSHITYTEQRNAVMKAMMELDISCTKKTHLGRDIAVAVGSKAGLSENSMKRHGFWKQDSFSGAYQAKIAPYDVIRVLAGFDSSEVSYYLERDLIDPPEELQKLIFPWVEESFIKIQNLLDTKKIKSEHSGQGFLKVLLLLRRVFLQDAAAFYLDSNDFSKYRVFTLPLFKKDDFIVFQKKIKDSINDPSNKLLFHGGTENKLNLLLESQAEQRCSQEKNFKRLFEEVSKVLDSVDSQDKKLKRIQKTFIRAAQEISEINSSSLPSDTEEVAEKDVLVEEAVINCENEKSNNMHRMAEGSVVNTVRMVYREWFEGWDKRPSIVKLLKVKDGKGDLANVAELLKNGSGDLKWRYQDDKKVYSRRSKIIRAINKLVVEGNTLESAISILEEQRGKMAISSFSDGLKN